MLERSFASAVALALVLTGTAVGATVHADGDTLTYTAGVGEQNVLTFDEGESQNTIVRDPGATIVAMGECVSRDLHTAVCSFMPALEVELGDLNDSVVGPDLDLANVRGGEGNDTLRWAGVGSVEGGPGDDVLIGRGTEEHSLIGGPGADTFRGGLRSLVTYWDRRVGVRVTIDGLANDGLAGEHDNVTRSIRFVFGSRGSDVIVGNDGSQWLYGQEGADRLVGRGARDVFFPAEGNDTVMGGAGNDGVRDFGGNDRLFGGPGADGISAHGGADVLVGGPGRDGLNGGPGPDRIFARDGARDHVFGGVGRDRARVDGFDRVGTVERVL